MRKIAEVGRDVDKQGIFAKTGRGVLGGAPGGFSSGTGSNRPRGGGRGSDGKRNGRGGRGGRERGHEWKEGDSGNLERSLKLKREKPNCLNPNCTEKLYLREYKNTSRKEKT